jgi:hypothetical protein
MYWVDVAALTIATLRPSANVKKHLPQWNEEKGKPTSVGC